LNKPSAQENVQRVLNALDQDLGAIDRFTYDRASPTMRTMPLSEARPEFIHSVLGKDANGSTQTRRFNFILLIDASRRIIASRGRDLVTQQVMEIPESLKAHMSLTDPLLQSAEAKGAITGLLMLPEVPSSWLHVRSMGLIPRRRFAGS